MPKRSFRIVAGVLAVPLLIGAAAIVRAHSPAKGSSASADNATTPGTADGVPGPATNADALGRLLAVSTDGAGAGLPTYTAAGTTGSSSVSSWIKSKYPKQAAATQTSDPATKYWALLIGLNDYAGSTTDNVGSRQDAQTLQSLLLKLGWRQDHIILITDRDGTAAHIIDGIRWLASKTNSSSTAVFHYSGHEDWQTSAADHDDSREIEIWASDNRMITEVAIGKEFNRIGAGRMWIDFATCRAAGFDEPGMVKRGRVLTFSSPETEYSYEDPKLHHSVFGWFMIYDAMYEKYGDANHDGTVTVEEAFAYAKPRVYSYTDHAQDPVMVDDLSGSLDLRVPPPPRKPAPQSSSGTNPTPSSTAPKTCVVICF